MKTKPNKNKTVNSFPKEHLKHLGIEYKKQFETKQNSRKIRLLMAKTFVSSLVH